MIARRAWARLGLGVLATGAFALTAAVLPLDDLALRRVGSAHGAGVAGAAAYALSYVVATLLLLPGSILTAGAGFAFGPFWGTLLASPVSVLAATLAFLLGRTVLRNRVARRVGGDPRFVAIDEAVGRSGFKLVLLLRLSPLFPFNLLNYGLGLSRVRLRDYVLASFLGMLPGTALYVYLGSLAASAGELTGGVRASAGPFGTALYWVGLAATLGVVLPGTRLARRALRREMGPDNARNATA